MEKKISIVTGASQGIGKATTRGLAEMGFEVVMVSRDHYRGHMARDEIIKHTGNKNIHVELVDLSDMNSIRELARRLSTRYPAIHVLVNNHCAFFDEWTLSPDGFEMNFALNHLAYFLLTNLLIENLKKGAGRIVNVAAQVHANIEQDFLGRPASRESYNPWDAYCEAKLGNILFTYSLARILEGTPATVNCLHPGIAQTFALTNARKIYTRLNGPTEYTTPGSHEAAARTSLYLATSPQVDGVSGKYFVNCEAVASSDLSYDRSLQDKLWQKSVEMTGLGG
jgi:NAD(P)-dependent dehydrogenase (short-subunit alcohol dehydrogenase family)